MWCPVLFGGMGGCAMIGQTVINLSSGGRGRLSGVVAGVSILLFILFLSPLIERIPLAALVGVMFVVSQQTFAWASLRVLNKVPLNDVLVIIAVTVITVFTDLATAVLCGIIIAALNFAWQQARAAVRRQSPGERRQQAVPGAWHACSLPRPRRFSISSIAANDPAQVTLDCRHLSFVDYSAIAALETLRERYAQGWQAPAGAAPVRALQETAQARPDTARLRSSLLRSYPTLERKDDRSHAERGNDPW